MSFTPSVHSFTGPVIAGFPDPYLNASITGALVSASHSAILTLANSMDFASGNPNGVGRWAFSLRLGSDDGTVPNLRSSSAVSYLFSLGEGERGNLVVLTGHRATRILWSDDQDEGGLKAVGVEFIGSTTPTTTSGTAVNITVKEEVIISAGAVGVCLIALHIWLTITHSSILQVTCLP